MKLISLGLIIIGVVGLNLSGGAPNGDEQKDYT